MEKHYLNARANSKEIGLLASTMLAIGGELPKIKSSAAQKRMFNDRRKSEPPRSMSEAEKEYYKKHKTLEGFQY